MTMKTSMTIAVAVAALGAAGLAGAQSRPEATDPSRGSSASADRQDASQPDAGYPTKGGASAAADSGTRARARTKGPQVRPASGEAAKDSAQSAAASTAPAGAGKDGAGATMQAEPSK